MRKFLIVLGVYVAIAACVGLSTTVTKIEPDGPAPADRQLHPTVKPVIVKR